MDPTTAPSGIEGVAHVMNNLVEAINDNLFGGFRLFFDMVNSAFESLRNALSIIGESISFIFSAQFVLPGILGSAVIVTFSVYLVKFLTKR